MQDNPVLISSLVAGFAHPVAWESVWLDMEALGSDLASFHIVWRDLFLNWYLWRTNRFGDATAPPADDFTAAYRLRDPAFVDPALADPLSSHVVAILNPGARYIKIGYINGNWAGANHRLEVAFYRNKRIY